MTKIQKSETHDRLSVWGEFATGGSFRFTISRAGEYSSWAGSNQEAEGKEQLRKFEAFCRARGEEKNGDRIRRIYDRATKANSSAEFVALMD